MWRRKKKQKAQELRDKIELDPVQLWTRDGARLLKKKITPETTEEFARWINRAPTEDAPYFFFLANFYKKEIRDKLVKYGVDFS